jgi:hypothetical protein
MYREMGMTYWLEKLSRRTMHSAGRPHPHPPFDQEEITGVSDEKIDDSGDDCGHRGADTVGPR